MNNYDIETVANKIIEMILNHRPIPIEVSGRHVHLSQEDMENLFGKGYSLTKKKDLSQPGQFQSNEKVMLIGPKGVIKNVSVLGPVRNETQVEVSKTDAAALGINPPVRESGNLKKSESLIIAAGKSVIKAEEKVIVAKRHIHMTPFDARLYGVQNGDNVKIQTLGERSLTFGDVVIRVSNKYKTAMHIDFDEANACCYLKGMNAKIVK
ncbi:phosphate propanoyltransferase [Clostridium sp. AWRP]|uniref:phosphate propanoyltransferase n=1 Tax=Clostridium sp. AWRP TaxID=2212991 RepID=UPI000FDC67A3|nr:phosphate propanoyltransferase [Clostridium sp. AWRP]AZV58030.1 phosphate propanoyltransferase [Clostridium sp. AWRP]